MIFNMSPKSLTLLLAVGVVLMTTASNLHRRRAAIFQHKSNNEKGSSSTSSIATVATAKQQLRSPSASVASASAEEEKESTAIEEETMSSAVEGETAAAAAAIAYEPSILLDKQVYSESEPIAVTLSVGSPTHPYYSSTDAPSSNIDRDYPKWSVGLFMRDADPQGGTLIPIVRVNLCRAMGGDCDVDDRDFLSYNDVSVTFPDERLDVMDGRWPLEVSKYGTGFDAYVLDGKGAAAIGPFEFLLRGDDDEEPQGAEYRGDHPSGAAEFKTNSLRKDGPGAKKVQALRKKGTKMVTAYRPSEIDRPSVKANVMIKSANGLGMSSEDAATREQGETDALRAGSSITSDKEVYKEEEPVSVHFSLRTRPSDDLSKYRIGLFRMNHPPGSVPEPVRSLPLCSENYSKCAASGDSTTGSVTFSNETKEFMMPDQQWPINLYEWGTGYDAYILDENGDDVMGPVKFNINMNDTV